MPEKVTKIVLQPRRMYPDRKAVLGLQNGVAAFAKRTEYRIGLDFCQW
jgi:hypothetical protein